MRNKYTRTIYGYINEDTKVAVDSDVYDVCNAFITGHASHERAHAVKKVLCTGERGSKDFIKDIDEAIATLEKAKIQYSLEIKQNKGDGLCERELERLR